MSRVSPRTRSTVDRVGTWHNLPCWARGAQEQLLEVVDQILETVNEIVPDLSGITFPKLQGLVFTFSEEFLCGVLLV